MHIQETIPNLLVEVGITGDGPLPEERGARASLLSLLKEISWDFKKSIRKTGDTKAHWQFLAKWEGERQKYHDRTVSWLHEAERLMQLPEGQVPDDIFWRCEIGTEKEIWNTLDNLLSGTLQPPARDGKPSKTTKPPRPILTAEHRFATLLENDTFLHSHIEMVLPCDNAFGRSKFSTFAISETTARTLFSAFQGFVRVADSKAVENLVRDCSDRILKAKRTRERKRLQRGITEEQELEEYKQDLLRYGVAEEDADSVDLDDLDGTDTAFTTIRQEMERAIIKAVNSEVKAVTGQSLNAQQRLDTVALVRATMEEEGITLKEILGAVKRGLHAKKDEGGKERDDHSSQLKAANLAFLAGGYIGQREEPVPEQNDLDISITISGQNIENLSDEELMGEAIRRARAKQMGVPISEVPQITAERMEQEAERTGYAPTGYWKGKTGDSVILKRIDGSEIKALNSPEPEEDRETDINYEAAKESMGDVIERSASAIKMAKPDEMAFMVQKRDTVERGSKHMGSVRGRSRTKATELQPPAK